MLNPDEARPIAPPKDAATVVLLRDAGSSFEVFLIRRHMKSAFMGGAHVFPGGKLDAEDASDDLAPFLLGRSAKEAADALGEPDDPTTARALFVAAIRETWEEAAVLLGEPGPSGKRLERSDRFLESVTAKGATLRLDWLTPWTRWITPAAEPRRYDTRFFLARIPRGQVARDDSHETTSSCWMTPELALTAHAREQIVLPPPTLRSIEVLAMHPTVALAMTAARAVKPPTIEPVFRNLNSGPILALPGDPEHPEKECALPGPTRFELLDGRWRSAGE